MNDLWEKLDPGFLAPAWLLAGLLAVIAVVLLEIGAYRRRRQALLLFAAPHLVNDLTGSVSMARRLVKRLLLAGGVACLFIALARPHLFFRWQEEARHGIDILVAVDCSKSMLTQDVKPSRLERAKLAISDFADRLPDDRLGLIAFAGDAFLQVPLTLDHDAFQSAVRELDTDTIPRPGTDVATAIDQAVLASKSQGANAKILILVTDGEDLEGRALSAAKEAAQTGLKIYTIGVGTPEGDLIPETDENGTTQYLHDADGQIVKSRLDESMLKQIATDTGGAYARLGQQGQGLEEIYQQDIAPLPTHQVESRREKIQFEQYEWPLGLGILLLVGSMLLGERGRDRMPPLPPPRRRSRVVAAEMRRDAGAPVATVPAILLAAGMFFALPGHPLRAAATDQAERDYKAAHFPAAEEKYQDASAKHPQRDEIKFDLGDAAYKAGEYSQAEDAFRRTLETPDLGLQEEAYYNIGNAQFRQGEGTEKDDQKKTIKLWEDSLKSYESSMKLKMLPDTKHNYDFVKKKLEQMKQQQQEQQKKDQQQQQKNQQQKNSNSNEGKGGQNDKKQDQKNQPGNPNQNPGQQPNGQNQSQQQGQQDQHGQQPDNSQAQNGQQQNGRANAQEQPKQGHSVSRTEDQVDPGAKSRQDAEALLDSLKGDEKHITARSLQGDDQPQPPPSGKDW
jgi:Ca-activated chloride channel family protein